MINESINLEVKCDFNGIFFWTTQDCNLTDIRVTQEFYTPEKTSQEFPFETSLIERNASSVELNFNSIKDSISGVKASVNGVPVFDSNSLLTKNYSASIELERVNLTEGVNTLRFEANPGAEASLRSVQLNFTSPITPKENMTLDFPIEDATMNALDSITINYFINNVFLNGELLFKINGVTYVTTVYNAGWNSFTIDKEDLLEDNHLTISALTGRFEIEELRITYE
jgi:hypothetical protein